MLESLSSVLYTENFIKDTESNTKDESLLSAMRKAQIDLINELHPYTIRQLPNGRWQTYIKDSTKKNGRKEIKAHTEQSLYEKLSEVYLFGETFDNLFYDWIQNISDEGKKGETVLRFEQRYKKYIEPSKISAMNIRKIDIVELEKECNKIVSGNNVSYHEWQQIKTLLIRPFDFAIKKKLINENPMSKVKIEVNYRQVNKPKSETQVYKSDEYKDLLEYLTTEYKETYDDSFLAVLLQLFTGLRVGEITALQFKDVGECSLTVSKEEVRSKHRVDDVWVTECIVANHTKTYTDREVILVPNALRVINELKTKHPDFTPDSYLFTRDGERIRERQVAYVLEKYSKRRGKTNKSTHKLRKTYASRLNVSGVPLEQIRIELGQKYLSTTENYIFNPLTDEETYKLMAKAF